MKNLTELKSGFTIIEVLVVTVAVVVLLLGLTSSLFFSLKLANKAEAISLVNQEGSWMMSQIRDLVVHADAKHGGLICNQGVGMTITSILDGGVTSLACIVDTDKTYIASNSANGNFVMVAKDLKIENCENFVSCSTDIDPVVTINFTLFTGISDFVDTYANQAFLNQFVVKN